MTGTATKPLAALVGSLLAGAAQAQGAPSVNESTGDLSYAYSFELPRARGRHQPELALVYSSAANRDTGYGHGWTLASAYVELDTRAPPGKQKLWLVRGTERKLLVLLGTAYRQEVEETFFELTPAAGAGGTTYAAKDAVGTTYLFDRLFGSRAWLSRVTDLDGNVTEYAYDADKPEPTAIRYNLVPGTSFHANEVTLEYRSDLLATDGSAVPAQPSGVEGGAYLSHGKHLWRVRVNGPASVGTRATIRGYELAYSPASVGYATSIARITEYGLDFVAALPATEFTYQIAAGYSVEPALASAAAVSSPCGFLPDVYQDLDADGRPDIVCWSPLASGGEGYRWLRNVTAAGASSPSFEAVPRETRPPVHGTLQDFDGDGVLDVLVAWLSGTRHMHSIYRGRVTTGSPGWDATPIDLDVTDVSWLEQNTWPSLGNERSVLADLNGDGVMDYARRVNWNCGKDYSSSWPDCAWEYGFTELNPGGGSRVAKQAGTLPLVPGGGWYNLSPLPVADPRPGDAFLALDMNGDGLADAVWNPGSSYSWAHHHSYRVTTGSWRVTVNGGGGALAGVRGASWATGLSGHADGPEITLTCGLAICSPYTMDDPRYVHGDLQDFDGDGRADFYKASAITWNDGRRFNRLTNVSGGPAWARVNGQPHPFDIEWTTATSCSATEPVFDCCSATLPAPADSSHLRDLNGDGIPDLVLTRWTTSPPSLLLGRGVLAATDPALGAFPVARPLLLRKVRVRDGAVFTIDYVSSLTFGAAPGRPRPVVSALGVGGAFVSPNKTYYWYATPSAAPAWYDAVKRDERGFAESWSQDEVTRIVHHTRWKTGSHPLIGRPETVESGYAMYSALGTPAANGAPGGPPSGLTWFFRKTLAYGVRNLGAGSAAPCASTAPGEEPAAATYPLRVIPTGVSESTFHGTPAMEAKVTTTIACGEVDIHGNVVRTTVTPSLGGVAGKTLVTTQTFVGWLANCKNAFGSIQVARWDGTNKLSEETKLFDSSCRLVEQYATGSSTSKTNRTTFTYAGPLGLMDTSTTGGVTKRISYDVYALHVSEEQSDDGQTALSTTNTYDPATGLRLSFSGPRVVKKAGSPFAGPAGITRYYLYDAFGRTLAVAKSSYTLGGSSTLVPRASEVKDAVEAYQYLDAASPPAVVSLRYAVPRTYSTTGSPPSPDDTARSVAYRDGLGRVIQVRERLGGGGAADAAARVTQTLGGYKVARAGFLDGAGRESVSLDPFYEAGEAFVDYRAVSIPATRGTVVTFDAQGRPWCTAHQYVAGVLPGPATSCYSDSSHSSSYRLATETRYGNRVASGRGPHGGYFVAVAVIPPDQNVSGGGMKPATKLLGPLGEELGLLDADDNRTWVERDALGREVASWRELRPDWGTLRTPNPASTIRYNLAGQVVESWDANWNVDPAKMVRKSRYDEAGRLVYLTLDPATGEGIEYLYGTGDLGRVTEVREVSYPTVNGPASVKRVALNHYDHPYSAADAGYSFVAGKLSWTENAETKVAYGYDDAGRVWRRDQWFTKLDATRRFTVSSTYGTDGRVLDSRVVNPYSATAEYQYFVDYDSAGRPVALSGKLASQASLVKVYEVVPSQGPSNGYGGYDALGRVPVMRADGGRAVSARRYNGYSGALEGECKRFGDSLACGTVSAGAFGAPPALDAAKDIFRTDRIAATYRGAKLASYEDSGAATRYTNTYLPNGRLSTSKAEPTGAVGSLTQDWLETFLFSGIGIIDRVDAQRNAKAGNARPDRFETQRYTPESPAPGQALDKVSAVVSRLSATSGGAPLTGASAATAESVRYSYDLLGHLTSVTRVPGESETLAYAPGGELLYRQVGEKFTFYVGEYATVTARGTAGCGASCVPQAATVEMDAHVVFAGTRIASAKPSRTLYYYRTRLGSVVATSYRDSAGNSYFGAGYRYTPYGEVELSVNETDTTRSELGYTNALRLTGSLLHLKNRVYDTRARVFIQADTVDRLRYAYVMGDPVNLSDPSGLLPIDGDIRTAAAYFGSRTAEREAAVEHAKAIERAEQQAKTSEAQTARESEVQKEAGTALHNESTLDKVTSAAASTTQKLADYSVNDKNPLVLRGLVAFAGGVTSLLDRESIGKTGLTLGIGVLVLGAVAAAPALLAASPEAAAGGGAAAAASPAGQRAIVTAAEQANRLHHIFDNAGHRLGPLVEALGSQQAAFGAVERATQAAARSQGLAGVFKTTVQVAGQEIVVKGKVIDGVARIGSFWRQP